MNETGKLIFGRFPVDVCVSQSEHLARVCIGQFISGFLEVEVALV